MLAKLNSCGIIMGKTEENVRIPFRLHNISRFPRAASPLLYLLLFLHSHGKGRPDGRPFLARETMEAGMDAGLGILLARFLLLPILALPCALW